MPSQTPTPASTVLSKQVDMALLRLKVADQLADTGGWRAKTRVTQSHCKVLREACYHAADDGARSAVSRLRAPREPVDVSGRDRPVAW